MAAKKLFESLHQSMDSMKIELQQELGNASAQLSALQQTVENGGGHEEVIRELRYTQKQLACVYEGIEELVDEKLVSRLPDQEQDKAAQAEQLAAVQALQASAARNGETLAAQNAKIAEQDAKLAEQNSKLDEQNTKIDAQSAKLDEQSEKIDEQNAKIDAQSAKLDEQNTKLDAQSAKLDEQNTKLDAQSVKLDEQSAKLDEQSEKLGALEEMRSALAELTELKYNYQQLQSAYESLVSELNTHTEKVVAAVLAVKPEPVDYDRLAALVAARVAVPMDYDRIAELVSEKLAAKEQSYDVVLDDEGVDAIADRVVEKMQAVEEKIDYDRVYQAAQAAQILPDPVDYDRIAEIVEDKLCVEEDTTYDLTLDDEGIDAIAEGVASRIRIECVCTGETPVTVEETVEDVTEECAVCDEAPVEEVAEEPVEEVVEEIAVAEAAPVEEVAEEPVEEPVAEPEVPHEDVLPVFEEVGDDLIDAETGLIIRLKKSFTAKMRQSERSVKEYYSQIKNELISHKRINSNVSWHGDRFNFGRDTVAKINICGKTLCFYLALDPNDPEFKSTIYHQKDVSGQKAYESTPFLVKVKSDAAAKKAVRLATALAEKLGTEKDEEFTEVDYVKEYAYETTKKLYDDGFIKATKEKKVDLNF